MSKKYITGTLTKVDVEGNNVPFLPRTKASEVFMNNLSTVEDSINNVASDLADVSHNWKDGDADNSVYLTGSNNSTNNGANCGESSISGGYNTLASGLADVSLGAYVNISKQNSSVQYSQAMGDRINISANESQAMGSNITIGSGANNAKVIGNNMNICAPSSVVMGDSVYVAFQGQRGQYINNVFALGKNLQLHSSNSIVVGSNVQTVSLNNAIVFGENIYQCSTDGLAMGSNISIGRYFDGAYHWNLQLNNCVAVGSNIYQNMSNAISLGADISQQSDCVSVGKHIVASSGITGNSAFMGSYIYATNSNADNSLALGSYLYPCSINTVMVGRNLHANGSDSIIIGRDLDVSNEGSKNIVIGTSNNTGTLQSFDGSNSIYIGRGVRDRATINNNTITSNNYVGEVSIGSGSQVVGNSALALGMNASSIGDRSTAVGSYSSANATTSVAIGYISKATGDRSTAVGYYSTANGKESFAAAHGRASGDNSIAIGTTTNSNGSASIAIGLTSTANSNSAIAIGTNTTVDSIGSLALGVNSIVRSNSPFAIAIGNSALVNNNSRYAIAIGAPSLDSTFLNVSAYTVAAARGAIAYGEGANASGAYSKAIGVNCNATNNGSCAIGSNVQTSGKYSTTIGLDTSGSGAYSATIGTYMNSSANYSCVIGANSSINSSYSVAAVGPDSSNVGVNSNGIGNIIIGNNIASNGANSIIIGSGISLGSISMNNHSVANKTYSTAVTVIGSNISVGTYNNTASNKYEPSSYSVSYGQNIVSRSPYSISFGRDINSSGVTELYGSSTYIQGQSVVVGTNVNHCGVDSIITGVDIKTNSKDSFILGRNSAIGSSNNTVSHSLILANSMISGDNRSITDSILSINNSVMAKNISGSLAICTNCRDSGQISAMHNSLIVASDSTRVSANGSVCVINNHSIMAGVNKCLVIADDVSLTVAETGEAVYSDSLYIGSKLDVMGGVTHSEDEKETYHSNAHTSMMVCTNTAVWSRFDTNAVSIIGDNISVGGKISYRPDNSFILSDAGLIRYSDIKASHAKFYEIEGSSIITTTEMENDTDNEWIFYGNIENSKILAYNHRASSNEYDLAMVSVKDSSIIVDGSSNMYSSHASTAVLSNSNVAMLLESFDYEGSSSDLALIRKNSATKNAVAHTIRNNIDNKVYCTDVSLIGINGTSVLGTSVGSLIIANGSIIAGSSNENAVSTAINSFSINGSNFSLSDIVTCKLKQSTDHSIIVANTSNVGGLQNSLIMSSNSAVNNASFLFSIIDGGTVKNSDSSLIISSTINHARINTSNNDTYTPLKGTIVNNTNASIIVGSNCNVYNCSSVAILGSDISVSSQSSCTIVGTRPTAATIKNARFVVGDGSETSDKTAFVTGGSQGTKSAYAYQTIGADYAEYMEWSDGNPNNEDRCGKFVTMDPSVTDKLCITIANNNSYIMGIVSGNPSVIGNSDMEWRKQYLTDEFDRIIYEERTDEDGVIYEVPKLNPEFNANEAYIPRKSRKEWDTVGMRGLVPALEDGTCEVGKYVRSNDTGYATASNEPTRFMCVLKRENTVLIDVK
jgi:hypothetical protein